MVIDPMGKPRMTKRDKWQQRPAVMRYRSYCDQLRIMLGEDYELPEVLDLTFYIAMPKSWSAKKKQQMVLKPHRQKPDIDNLAKAFMDAFKKEDAHVYQLRAVKYWAERGEIFVG